MREEVDALKVIGINPIGVCVCLPADGRDW